MADQSAFIPNSFNTPNIYVDKLLRYLTGDEVKVLLFALRHTWGFPEREEKVWPISLTMFQHGYTSKAGHHFGGTGLSRPTLVKVIASLVDLKLLVKHDEPTNRGQRYGMGFEPDLVKLADRAEESRKTAGENMAKARAKKSGGKQRLPVNDINQGGKQHLPLDGKQHLLNQNQSQNQSQSQVSSGEPEAPEPPPSKLNNRLMQTVVAAAFDLKPGSRVGMLIKFLSGDTTARGQWGEHAIEPPVTDPAEPLAFRRYVAWEFGDDDVAALASWKPETVADRFDLFRATRDYDRFMDEGRAWLAQLTQPEEVKVTWTDPADDDGIPVQQYEDVEQAYRDLIDKLGAD